MKSYQINHRLLVAFLSFATLLAPLNLAYSQNATVTLFDNITGYNPSFYAFDQVYWYMYVGGSIIKQEVAQSFSTGNFSGTLSSVVLMLHNESGIPRADLHGDNGGKPGGFLGQLYYASGSMGYGYDEGQPRFGKLTLNGNGISLAPNTRYWVVLGEGGIQPELCIAPCGGEYWWADRPDRTSPRALAYAVDGAVVHDWTSTGSSYVPLMQVYATTSLLPHANAGASATAHVGSVVTLDGTGSSDPSGKLPLTYVWSFFSVPAGSSATISDPTAAGPGFTVDKPGDYLVKLVVTNSAGVASAPAFVTISTYNTAPVADPGPDQAIAQIGTNVYLDGSKSHDVDGDPITYSWTFLSKPMSSQANLYGDKTSKPSFVADLHGIYVIQLVVSDPWTPGTPKTVTVSFSNVKPVANAGTGQLARVGDLVTVNGSGSSDANLDPLTYQWSFATMPPNSLATLANPTAVQATFVPDQPGTYGVQLIVNDGFFNSDPSTVQVQVTAVFGDPLITLVSDEINLIGSLDPLVFRNSNLQNSLINKLQAVMSAIQSGDYRGAASKLQNDVLGKTDGCYVSGAPDQNDWIVTCAAQQKVYPNLLKIIAWIKQLVGER